MHELSLEDTEAPLVGLVGDTIPDPAPEHHLVAFHVVVHYILQLWHQGFLVNEEEVDYILCGHLDPHVALDVEDEASVLQLVVLNPVELASHRVLLLLEE